MDSSARKPTIANINKMMSLLSLTEVSLVDVLRYLNLNTMAFNNREIVYNKTTSKIESSFLADESLFSERDPSPVEIQRIYKYLRSTLRHEVIEQLIDDMMDID